MKNSRITTDIITTTGLTIDIPPAKVVINNQEITDLETFNKVVDSIREKNKEINRLNNIISEVNRVLESILFELDQTGEAEQVIEKIEYCVKELKEKE